MPNDTLEFAISESGSIIWVGAADLGGIAPEEFDLWDEMTLEQGLAMCMELYQDDGFFVKLTQEPLTAQEEAEWIARARWRINAECGRLLVSSVFSGVGDFADEYGYFEPAQPGCCNDVGVFIDVPPGAYQVEVYSFAPGDLSGGWGMIVNSEVFRVGGYHPRPELDPEDELSYFHRTRPGQEPPQWLDPGKDPANYINFIIKLSPFDEKARYLDPEQGFVPWEFRKPAQFPLGILSAASWE